MSTNGIYNAAEIRAAAEGPCEGMLSPQRHPQKLLEIVTRHIEATGESLSAFVRRAMVRTVQADRVHAEAQRVRRAVKHGVFED